MLNLNEDYLSKVEEENMDLTRERKQEGAKVVGVYCAFTPKELIVAAGGIPVSLCGSSSEPIPHAERHLPRNICPLVKSSYGSALTDTCPYFHFTDFLVADATCDAKKKMYELLGRIKPVFLLQLPQTGETGAAHNYWLEELYRLKGILEKQFNVKITEEKLRETIKLYNQARKKVREVFELNKVNPCFLTGKEIKVATDPGGFDVDLPGHMQRMETIIKLAKERGGIKKLPRVLLTGCPVTCKKVLEIIEESAVVAAMENCGGLKTISHLVEEEGDPMEALASYYLKIACPCFSPNRKRYELISQIIKEYYIEGVVDLTWQACHTYNVESFSLGEYVRQEMELPFLQIETDYSESDIGWIKVRVDAFLEMLNG